MIYKALSAIFVVRDGIEPNLFNVILSEKE